MSNSLSVSLPQLYIIRLRPLHDVHNTRDISMSLDGIISSVDWAGHPLKDGAGAAPFLGGKAGRIYLVIKCATVYINSIDQNLTMTLLGATARTPRVCARVRANASRTRRKKR